MSLITSSIDKWKWKIESTQDGDLFFGRWNSTLFPVDEEYFNYSIEEIEEFYKLFDKFHSKSKAPKDRLRALSFCKEIEIDILRAYNKKNETK